MNSDPATDKVLHFRRTTVILFLTGVFLTAALLAFSGVWFRTSGAMTRRRLSIHAASIETLVIYHYYEHQPHHDNFLYFLEHGMHGAADFLFVLNGDVSEAINASLPEHLSNVRVIRRDNTCFDLGSHGVALEQLEREGRLAQYKAIVLMNASVIGPIVPVYVEECWTRIFTNRLSGPLGMVGTTMNCVAPDERGRFAGFVPHFQSMLLAFSPAGLAAVRPALECYETKLKAIIGAEITFLTRVLSAGLQASVLDGSVASPIKAIPECEKGNVYEPGGFYGLDINPHDVVFFKNTPDTGNVSAAHLNLYKGFMDLRNYSSWDRC